MSISTSLNMYKVACGLENAKLNLFEPITIIKDKASTWRSHQTEALRMNKSFQIPIKPYKTIFVHLFKHCNTTLNCIKPQANPAIPTSKPIKPTPLACSVMSLNPCSQRLLRRQRHGDVDSSFGSVCLLWRTLSAIDLLFLCSVFFSSL